MTSSLPVKRWKFFGYTPNAWSLEQVHKCDKQFGAYVTCRQCGKTVTAGMEIDRFMEADGDEIYGPPHVGVLSSTYDKAELSVNRYINMVREKLGPDYLKVNLNKHTVAIPSTGARLTWMSADVPESVQGHTFSALIVDEAQNISDAVWELIFPTLGVRSATVRAFGTPDITPEQTWFKALFFMGQDPDEKQVHSFTLSAYENPWMDLEDIRRAKDTLPDRTFRQLYLGEWVDLGGSVFPNPEKGIIEGTAPSYTQGVRYVMACDFAVHEDYNVVVVAERATRTVVFMERWNKTDPIRTYDRITTIWEDWGKPSVIADASGFGGDAFIAELRERGIYGIRGFKFNSRNKLELIQRLQSAIEHRRLSYYNFPAIIRELKAYVYKSTPSGRLTAEAAAGFHDDCVSTLLLLNEVLRTASGEVGNPVYRYIGGEPTPLLGHSDNQLHARLRSRAAQLRKFDQW